MKKNNKFRNNGNSNAYSLNYKFDSISPAGKYSGTALDLIKRYNELAKEAHGSGDYVEMEVFRQYAEHYRKIVTEINERKNSRQENNAPVASEASDSAMKTETPSTNDMPNDMIKPTSVAAKSFQVIEIHAENEVDEMKSQNENAKPRKIIRRRKVNPEAAPKSSENEAAVM